MAISLGIFVAYAAIMLRGPQGLAALTEKRAQVRALEARNADLRHEIEDTAKRIEKLKNDPETAIRKHLGMQKADETTFKAATPAPVSTPR